LEEITGLVCWVEGTKGRIQDRSLFTLLGENPVDKEEEEYG